MELFIISGYVAICIVLFSIFRIPLNRLTVPTASVSGVVLAFALIQVLNYYHPHSDTSRQYLTTTPLTAQDSEQAGDIPMAIEERNLVAWFPEKSLLRLKHGSSAEVSFDTVSRSLKGSNTLPVVSAPDKTS